MTYEQLKRLLEHARDTYSSTVEAFGDNFRLTRLEPFLKRKGWYFLSGNGTWVILDKKTDYQVYDDHSDWDAECEEIAQMLDSEVLEGASFGALFVSDCGRD